jgi:hypothetical protein
MTTGARTDNPAWAEWVEEARRVPIERELERRGVRLKGRVERSGPCPRCAGDDRFSINTRDQVFNCRGSSDEKGRSGGDVIDMVRHLDGCEFAVAVEILTDRPPPDRDAAESPEERAAREARLAAERDRRARERAEEERAEQAEREATLSDIEALWTGARPVRGTHAAAYLDARGLTPAPGLLQDLRFVPELPYWGFPNDEAKRTAPLGSFPAIIALIRDCRGHVIGLHRTYLDPREPRKLKPPGASGNKAKKVLGKAKGGMIWLGDEPAEVHATGEGYETVLSWYVLGLVEPPITLSTSVSLGNLAGGATGSIPHPTRIHADSRPVMIPNGVPDMDAPGLVLPSTVRRLYLIGDGDSDRATTRAQLLVAARRFRALGREVFVSMAPDGSDFNDVLRAELGLEDAA